MEPLNFCLTFGVHFTLTGLDGLVVHGFLHQGGKSGGQFIGLLPAHTNGKTALRVSVHQQNFLALHRQPDAQIFTGGAFSDTTFLMGDRNNRSFLCDNITPLSVNRAQSRGSFCSDSRGSWWWAHCRASPADTASCSAPGRCFLPANPARSGCGRRSTFSADCVPPRQACHLRRYATSCVLWNRYPQAGPRSGRWCPHRPGRAGAEGLPPMPDKNNPQAAPGCPRNR